MNHPSANRAPFEAEAMRLILECPYRGDNPAFCPLNAVRKLDLWDRVKWVSCLTEEDLVYLSNYHWVCSRWLCGAFPQVTPGCPPQPS